MDIIVSGIVLILAVIAARVLLRHREFRDQKYIYIFDRNAINEETTGDQNYTVTERPGRTRSGRVAEYYKKI